METGLLRYISGLKNEKSDTPPPSPCVLPAGSDVYTSAVIKHHGI